MHIYFMYVFDIRLSYYNEIILFVYLFILFV